MQPRGVPATQPTCGSQVSMPLHTSLSLHASGVPAHWPAVQMSPVVQALPSSHGLAFGAKTHPSTGSQLSSVQLLLSTQLSAGVPPSHAPVVGLQASTPSQTVPLPALQANAAADSAPVQTPAAHASPSVQRFPSSQGF